MAILNIIWSFLFVFVKGDSLSKDTCKCSGEEPIINFIDTKSNRIIFCGSIDEKSSPNSYTVTEFRMINCLNNTVIEDHSEDAISKYSITVENNRVIIAKNHFIVNEKWQVISLPAMEKSVYFSGRKICISKEKNVLKVPALTKEQNDSINSLCEILKEKSINKGLYPYDETSIYILFTGAIKGNRGARYLLANLDRLFILDGAVKETKDEIWMRY
jgi:hypothetical protein